MKMLCFVVLVFLSVSFRACWGFQERTVVILYNKPKNVVTSHAVDDIKGRRNVYQEVCSMQGCVMKLDYPTSFQEATNIKSRLHAVGRLDADTTGALLLTNDGALVHHVTNCNAGEGHQHAIVKTYEAVIMGHHDDDSEMLQQMRKQGVNIGEKYGGWTRPMEDLNVLGHPSSTTTTVSLTISEGKNRQVRRMFHSMGSGVMKLKRTCIGQDLDLVNLQVGEWRILSDAEVQKCLQFTPRLLSHENKEGGCFKQGKRSDPHRSRKPTLGRKGRSR